MRHDDLICGIDRDLAVVALDEALARGQDTAVGIGDVLLRPVGRPAILAPPRAALPKHARGGA